MTRHPTSISILIPTLIIAAVILVGGPLGGIVIPRASAQAQSSPAGLWYLHYDVQNDSTFEGPLGYWSGHYYSQLAMDIYLNVTKEGKVDTFRTSDGEFDRVQSGYFISNDGILITCGDEKQQSFLFNVTGSVVGQVGELSAFAPSITQSKTQTSGSESCGGSAETAAEKVASFESDVLGLPWVDGFTSSIASDTSHSFSTVQGSAQDIRTVTVGLWRLQSYCKMLSNPPGSNYAYLPPVCVDSGNDDQGPISPPVNIPSPNSVTLSDGSTIHLGGSALSWNSPGNYTLNCPQTCASDSFNFLRDSWGTIVNVNCPSGPCATITAISGANFSLSAAGTQVTVNDFDGIVRVGALNSSSTVFLSGALGTYIQRVTVDTNENFTTLQKNAITTYATVPRTCNGGAILLNSGQPISGDLNSTQFCVPAGQVTRLQFSVPPPLQNMTSLYTATSNSSAIAILASGEDKTGTSTSGVMALSGIPTEMPIPLISPSGNDLVTIAVNNTGGANAVVSFQLLFPSLTVTSSTTSSSASTSTSSTTSTTPEFPTGSLAVIALVVMATVAVVSKKFLAKQLTRIS